ncbi:MAG: hypothetical protein JSV52_00250, partial [Candidatus Zixiibacteriota bacterium]
LCAGGAILKRFLFLLCAAGVCIWSCSDDLAVSPSNGKISPDSIPIGIDSVTRIWGGHINLPYFIATIYCTVPSSCWRYSHAESWGERDEYWVKVYIVRDSGALCPADTAAMIEHSKVDMDWHYGDTTLLHFWQSGETYLDTAVRFDIV